MKKTFIVAIMLVASLFAAETASAKQHTVKKGDTITKISKTYNVSICEPLGFENPSFE